MLLECERAPFELRLLSSLTMQRYNNNLNPSNFYCTFYTKNHIFFVIVLFVDIYVFIKILFFTNFIRFVAAVRDILLHYLSFDNVLFALHIMLSNFTYLLQLLQLLQFF